MTVNFLAIGSNARTIVNSRPSMSRVLILYFDCQLSSSNPSTLHEAHYDVTKLQKKTLVHFNVAIGAPRSARGFRRTFSRRQASSNSASFLAKQKRTRFSPSRP